MFYIQLPNKYTVKIGAPRSNIQIVAKFNE